MRPVPMIEAGCTAFAISLAAAVQSGAQPQPPQSTPPSGAQSALDDNSATEKPGQPLDKRVQILQALLYEQISVDFDGTLAREALTELEEMLGIPMIVRYSDDAVGFGIDPDTPIKLKVTDAPGLDVLEHVLEQCGLTEACTWQLRRGFLEVGTKERLSTDAAQELRVYPIDDLLTEPPDFDDAWGIGFEGLEGGVPLYPGFYRDRFGRVRGFGYGAPGFPGAPGRGGYGGGVSIGQGPPSKSTPAKRAEDAEDLIEIITMMIEPQAWQQNGGAGATIAYRDGSLIVRAPDFIHRQLVGYPKIPRPDAKRPESEAAGNGA